MWDVHIVCQLALSCAAQWFTPSRYRVPLSLRVIGEIDFFPSSWKEASETQGGSTIRPEQSNVGNPSLSSSFWTSFHFLCLTHSLSRVTVVWITALEICSKLISSASNSPEFGKIMSWDQREAISYALNTVESLVARSLEQMAISDNDVLKLSSRSARVTSP